MFEGTYTALVTPFSDGRVDTEALEFLIEKQIEGGITGIVPMGTTGESATLSHDEHVRVVELCVKVVNKRCKVIAGAGSNCTDEAIQLTQAAERAGVDGVLHVTPYYNKPTQEGLYQHFKTISEATDLPIMLYSIPGRCVVEIAIDTVRRLAADCDNIVAIKEAGGRVERVKQILEVVPPSFTVLSGDDALTLPFMRDGAKGVVSVASNLLPRELSEMVKLYLAGNADAAWSIHSRMDRLFRDLFIETNPIPVKAALAMRGWILEEYRLPLVPMARENRDRLETTLNEGGWM